LDISGELVGRFLRERKALNVICLNANVSVLTAWANDYDHDSVFARQVEAHGQPGGVCWGISTSGNSPNVLQALKKAKDLEM
jgi:D-sedoheptulose 7-phosphate isomerase